MLWFWCYVLSILSTNLPLRPCASPQLAPPPTPAAAAEASTWMILPRRLNPTLRAAGLTARPQGLQLAAEGDHNLTVTPDPSAAGSGGGEFCGSRPFLSSSRYGSSFSGMEMSYLMVGLLCFSADARVRRVDLRFDISLSMYHA